MRINWAVNSITYKPLIQREYIDENRGCEAHKEDSSGGSMGGGGLYRVPKKVGP